MSTITIRRGDSFQAIAPPNVVLTILRDTANDLLSRHSSTNFRVASIRKETITFIASSFLKWIEQCIREALVFAKSLQDLLAPCLFEKDEVGKLYSWSARELVWRKFHEIRGSPACDNLWKIPPSTVSTNDPVFQQTMLTGVLERLIKTIFPIAMPGGADEAGPASISLSEKDEKVIRYVAGYIPVSLHKKLERSSNPHKEEFIVCLWSMCEDDTTCDDFLSYTKTWISRVDRGGIFPVNNTSYLLFKQLEIEVQKNYNYKKLARSQIPTHNEMVEFITASKDVQFYWHLLSSDVEEEDANDELLCMIADLWIVIRGFSFARSLLEQYKQSHAVNTSKAKALRKGIS